MNQVQELFNFLPYGNTLSKTLLYFIASAVLAFALAPLIIHILYSLNIRRVSKGDIVGKIDEEKGKLGVPIMGGLIVIITTCIITLIFNWERQFTWLPIGTLLLSSSLGGIDDLLNIFGKDRKQPKPIKIHVRLAFVHKSLLKRIYYFITIPWAVIKRSLLFLGSKPRSGLQVHEKLLVQMFIGLTVSLWVYSKVGWSDVWIPYILHFSFLRNILETIPGVSVNLAKSSVNIGWLMVPFITLTIMTVTNAVNISDGMDGMSGGLMLMGFLAYGAIAFNLSQTVCLNPQLGCTTSLFEPNTGYRYIAYLCSTISGSLLAYLYFNVKPARVQMGDVGTLGLGTLLSVIAIITHREFTLIFIAGIFLFNGIIARFIQAFWKRVFGRKLFRVIPIHYHFELKGWPEEKVVMRFWIIGIILTAIGVWIAGI